MHVNPYLMFDGRCEEAFKLYERVTGGSDAPPGRYHGSQGCSETLRVDTPAEAERIFNGLSEGATIHMPLDKTFFAQKFGMLADKFGIPWMVICENPH